MEKETKDKAKQIFESYPAFETLYTNKKGEMFSSKNLAELSVKDNTEIVEIKRSDVIAKESGNTELDKAQKAFDKAQVAFEKAQKECEEKQGDAKSEAAFQKAETALKTATEALEALQK